MLILAPTEPWPALGSLAGVHWVLGLVEEVTSLEIVWDSVMCFLCHDARQSAL